MRQRPLLALPAAAALALGASPLHAQSPRVAAVEGDALPACSDQGVRRVAVMVPPGHTRDEFRAALQGGTLFPPGTEVVILEPGRISPLRDPEEFQSRVRRTLDALLRENVMIDGTVSVLLVLDAGGTVTEVHPNTRNGEVNRRLTAAWRRMRFVPYVNDGCRVPAYIHVPLAFDSDWSAGERQVQVRVAPSAPPPPPR